MKRVHLMLAAAVVFLVAQLSFGALPEYEIIDLGTLGGSYSSPSDINDDGQVVGHSWTADGPDHGFLWDEVNGMVNMTDLQDETSPWGEAEIVSAISINNNGQIVCRAYRRIFFPSPSNQPIMNTTLYLLWDSETGFVELTAFGDKKIRVHAINDNMQIVGRTMFSNPLPDPGPIPSPIRIPIPGSLSIGFSHAFLWDSVNGITDLGTLGGRSGYANNINESGVVVGASTIDNTIEAHAFLWDSDNSMFDLGTLGGNGSSAWAINNYDKVVGASEFIEQFSNHAFIWSEANGMIDIHDSDYRHSIAYGINDADQVVGFVANDMHINHLNGMIILGSGMCQSSECIPSRSAFLWDKRYGMVELNDLLDEDSQWDYLESAKDINFKGQIIGMGYINGEYHAFLMNPVLTITAEVEIRPGTLNLSGRGKFNCNIKLPEDYDVAEINTDSILLADTIKPDQVRVDKRKQVVTARFDSEGLRDILEVGEVELTVTGELTDGTKFEGATTIMVIDRAKRARPAVSKRRSMTVPRNHLNRTSNLILQSSKAVGRVESLVLILHDLAWQSYRGSYSTPQREELDAEFQAVLAMIDPTVERAGLRGINMLDSESAVVINISGEVLTFYSVDITQAGLELDGELYIATPSDARVSFEHVEAAVRRIKEVDLLFNDYRNTLSRYMRNIKPILDKEVKQRLEIMEASKEGAETISSGLSRAIELAEQVIGGGYSAQQMHLMNAEFYEILHACGRVANRVYYGMGMIDSTDIVMIDTGKGTLEFAEFDLTRAGLGVDFDLGIATPQDAQIAYPYIVGALQSAQDAITGLDGYIDTLSEYVDTKGKKKK